MKTNITLDDVISRGSKEKEVKICMLGGKMK
jgi:hypothetical protein